MKNHVCFLVLVLVLPAGCGGSSSSGSLNPPPPAANALYVDVSATSLPLAALGGLCMDSDAGDIDGDGDIDLVLAQEFARNLILTNDGSGSFTAAFVPGGNGDNEDVRLRDFNNDGRLDMLTVHEDDGVHALFINNGAGSFLDRSAFIPVNSIANAAEVIDLDADQRLDILLGNRGTNLVLLQQANGAFVNVTAMRPIGGDTTQDLLLLDIDGDTDQDLFVANETDNRLFVNNGSGFFTNETAARLPGSDGESREADVADIDNDGDLDIIVANVNFSSGRPIRNQLLVNDGNGVFADETDGRLSAVRNTANSFTIRFVDLDSDGDADILSPDNSVGQGGSIDVWLNDGSGVFAPAPPGIFSPPPSGSAFNIQIVDVNADGKDDIYFCYRTGTDQMYMRQ